MFETNTLLFNFYQKLSKNGLRDTTIALASKDRKKLANQRKKESSRNPKRKLCGKKKHNGR